MTAVMVPIHGGPADGMSTGAGQKFAWIEAVALKRSERRDTAGLYELRDDGYVFIGGHTSRCDACGGFFDRAEGGAERQPCPMCGAQP